MRADAHERYTKGKGVIVIASLEQEKPRMKKNFSAARAKHHAAYQQIFCGRNRRQRGDAGAAETTQNRDVVGKQTDQRVGE